MRAWDSVTGSGSLRPGAAALGLLLLALLLSLTPLSQRIETAWYDFLVSLHEAAGSSQVVILDPRGLAAAPEESLWDSERFPELLTALHRQGARAVLVVEPPPPTVLLPDAAQLAALAELQRHRRADAADSPPGPADQAFAQQLASMKQRAEHHDRLAEAIRATRILVVGAPVIEGNRSLPPRPSACRLHVLQAATEGVLDELDLRRVRAVSAPPATLCDGALGAGHTEFWADDDGVVRHADLLLDASGDMVPAAVLRTVLALAPADRPPAISASAIAWDKHTLRTTAGARMLLRFYAGARPHSAFRVMAVEEWLESDPAEQPLAGRFVVLGHAEARADEPAWRTPVAERTSTALLTATALSNLLQQDPVARPAWSGLIETLILVALGAIALAAAPRLPLALTLMLGLSLALLLLGIEAWLLLARDLWVQLGTAAAFAIAGLATIGLFSGHRTAADTTALPAAAPTARATAGSDDELDQAFSRLRHQQPTERVKQRLYDIAVEHARRHDLAKAERVLRHLASVDPTFRNAGDKLKKLAGLRQQAAPAPERPRPPPPPPEPEPDVDSLAGQHIGRYHIEEAIGRGAMATVYLGLDPKINRRVAIKTIALAEEFSDTDLETARAQFLREAESAGRLNHPTIISIYDAGEDGSIAYLAMEYFSGKALSYYAQPGQLLPAETVLELMARVAEALHYAHAQHVVHRDVKPANLLYDKASDTLKITDFGIARLTDSSRTKTGIILGTPSYMSPEQLAGTNVSGQSDLFSLGITTYQLLTGVAPFRADTIPMLMQKIAHERHPAISEFRADLPACVEEFFTRALAKEPADRFSNGRAMALALRDCCSSFGVSRSVAAS